MAVQWAERLSRLRHAFTRRRTEPQPDPWHELHQLQDRLYNQVGLTVLTPPELGSGYEVVTGSNGQPVELNNFLGVLNQMPNPTTDELRWQASRLLGDSNGLVIERQRYQPPGLGSPRIRGILVREVGSQDKPQE